jgi:predicted HAD superfamily Cof-like phosphohydrolase
MSKARIDCPWNRLISEPVFFTLQWEKNVNQHQKWVRDFHVKYGGEYSDKPVMLSDKARFRRARLIIAEAAEFMDAAGKDDMVEMVDALADLLYVTYGTAVEMGVDIEPVFAEVQRSNMTKDGGGQDSGGKILKGPNFSPPDLVSVLKEQGWNA